jgi:GTPase SAR1 family protein
VTNVTSFRSLDRWLSKLKAEAEENCVIIICGNKRIVPFHTPVRAPQLVSAPVDLVEEEPNRRRVEFSEAQELAALNNAEALEVSARTGSNVSDVFTKIVEVSLERNLTLPENDPAAEGNLVIDSDSRSSDKTCC